ncbi:hypothetical protein GOC91_20025 [Sinorhizobium medicae]|nr:hypothetical protein [Sinorhizobium medicae]MDX0442571.1 hypothetical protein [Sinorhizobium medicae]MDX0463881.1 hypothetical protein [Sinorhizobium medicae]MDX0487278.1 hypothetical protein [Sinorhizobium medicae]MDX0488680.1 hypothetical protein [Sinorhizobium medicae]
MLGMGSPRRYQAFLLYVSFNRIRLKDKTCSRSKCYSDLCASDKTHGAVVYR